MKNKFLVDRELIQKFIEESYLKENEKFFLFKIDEFTNFVLKITTRENKIKNELLTFEDNVLKEITILNYNETKQILNKSDNFLNVEKFFFKFKDKEYIASIINEEVFFILTNFDKDEPITLENLGFEFKDITKDEKFDIINLIEKYSTKITGGK